MSAQLSNEIHQVIITIYCFHMLSDLPIRYLSLFAKVENVRESSLETNNTLIFI